MKDDKSNSFLEDLKNLLKRFDARIVDGENDNYRIVYIFDEETFYIDIEKGKCLDAVTLEDAFDELQMFSFSDLYKKKETKEERAKKEPLKKNKPTLLNLADICEGCEADQSEINIDWLVDKYKNDFHAVYIMLQHFPKPNDFKHVTEENIKKSDELFRERVIKIKWIEKNKDFYPTLRCLKCAVLDSDTYKILNDDIQRQCAREAREVCSLLNDGLL